MHMDPDGRARALRRTVATYRRHRFAWLFASLLLTLGAGPTLDVLVARYNPLQLLLALNLLAAIASVAHEERMRPVLLLGIAFVVIRGLRAALGLPGMLALSEGLWLTAIVLAMVATVRHALASGVVDGERILAALDAYLLAGLLFGVAYWMLEQALAGVVRRHDGRPPRPARARSTSASSRSRRSATGTWCR